MNDRNVHNDKNVHYPFLAHPLFSDAMFASTVFRRGEKCAQVYTTDSDGLELFYGIQK